MNTHLVCIMYDGIGQAIFESQVLLPLIARKHQELYTHIMLVSFETECSPELTKLAALYKDRYSFLDILLYKRSRFIAPFFLLFQAHTLRSILKNLPFYTLIARGPFAGFIAKWSVTSHCTKLIIQARGLVAGEYAYTHQNSHGFSWLWHAIRTYQFFLLEKAVYTPPFTKKVPFFIEPVSPALQQHLSTTFGTPPKVCINPTFDLPPQLPTEQQKAYRTAIRTQLEIAQDASVYVYNGSLKPWQCPQETLSVFKQKWDKDPRSIFLALTPDTKTMESLLKKTQLPPSSYRVLHIPHDQILPTLCAGDYGFLLRESHLINWVSRPTKLLEYESAGLQVIHNNTIELLLHKREIDKQNL